MTSTFNKYFKKCWSHISAVLEGGDQEEAIKKFEGMATDILEWNDTGKELDLKESQVIQTIKKLAGINVVWYLLGMLQFVQGAREKNWRWTHIDQDLWDNGLCPKFKPGANRIWQNLLSTGTPMVCLPASTADNRRRRLNLTVAQLLRSERDFRRLRQRCPQEDWMKDVKKGRIDYTPDGQPRWKHGPSAQLVKSLKDGGVVPSCQRQFAFRWYDASDRVIESLCNKAVNESIPNSLDTFFSQIRGFKDKPLPKEYDFRLVTGFPGSDFKSDTRGSNYQGFVMCFDTTTPSDEDIRSKVMSHGLHKEKAEEQKMCRYRTYQGKERNTRVFFSTLKIERDGKLFISNRHHKGYIGSCRPGLLQDLRDVNDKKVRETRDVSDVTQNKQTISAEDIVRAFVEAEKEGLIKVNETYGNSVDQWNATSDSTAIGGDYDDQWSDTAPFIEKAAAELSLELNPLDAISGCPEKICGPVRTAWSYWPYMAGVAGAILTLYTAKKVYECCRPQVIIHKHYMIYKRHKKVADEEDV
eukprot:Blabericola_migrator_1__4210@NODE_2291_length_2991_cov_309_777702_g548_i2_p1_GENE_NODE_2291_length_2991_cov_309_777702_g548_i2NODE_2291_length_2991_cov_309_777702_g548_i2_p1_ORF_typecomplete_len526_score69_17_NODE_2291_length_2991_cov_309_777702_g548_i211212698